MPTSAACNYAHLESDLLCFTHLRWHWMPSRIREGFVAAARGRRVFIVEEPVFVPGEPVMDVEYPHDKLAVARPCLPYALLGAGVEGAQRILLNAWLASLRIRPGVAWYHSPAAFPFSAHLDVPITVYHRVADPTALADERLDHARMERDLLRRADVVYADAGASVERIRRMHSDVRVTPATGGMAAFFAATPKPATSRSEERRLVAVRVLPGDRPGEQRAEHLQRTRIQPSAQRGRGWEEPRLERGP